MLGHKLLLQPSLICTRRETFKTAVIDEVDIHLPRLFPADLPFVHTSLNELYNPILTELIEVRLTLLVRHRRTSQSSPQRIHVSPPPFPIKLLLFLTQNKFENEEKNHDN